ALGNRGLKLLVSDGDRPVLLVAAGRALLVFPGKMKCRPEAKMLFISQVQRDLFGAGFARSVRVHVKDNFVAVFPAADKRGEFSAGLRTHHVFENSGRKVFPQIISKFLLHSLQDVVCLAEGGWLSFGGGTANVLVAAIGKAKDGHVELLFKRAA